MVYAVQRHDAVLAIIAITLDDVVNLIPESDDFVIARTKTFLGRVHSILQLESSYNHGVPESERTASIVPASRF
jgi:hypothetical protein